jgi:hypothetical protein
MELTLLTIPGCPNAAVFEERLAIALAGYPVRSCFAARSPASGRQRKRPCTGPRRS